MKILTWILRGVVFVAFFMFAAQNTETVAVRLMLGHSWQLPLVMVLLIAFACGAVLGMLSLLGLVFRQRREIARLRRAVPETPATRKSDG